MDLLEKNNDLTPFKLCLCILLYESLTNSKISSADKTKTLAFIVKQIQSSPSLELSYPDLLSSISHINSSLESPELILSEKVNSMNDFSDVLNLFIVKLNELKSDGDINSGSLEQGGILYLYLRKCFVSFARMGFEDLVSLSGKFQAYKAGKTLCHSSLVRASLLASSLEKQILGKDYDAISKEVGSLNSHAKYLIQGHIDALYHKNSAIDNIHRYFDLVLDQQMPTKTTREKGLVVVQSSTHFASLHRVKIELQLGHLEAAVHLLVETIKRALSENDNLVILESTLLFMKIASMMGNYKQEIRISQKAVLHGLKVDNIKALIETCLFYSQLHLVYSVKNAPGILAEIQPKSENKPKGILPVAKKLNFSQGQHTWVSLCDYAMLESLLAHEHKGLHNRISFITVTHWVNQGFDWNLSLHLENLQKNFDANICEVNFFLGLVREICRHNLQLAQKILKLVDFKCVEKKCVQWEFTLAYVGHWESLKKGEFLQATYFEEVAEKTGEKSEVDLMRLCRLAQQKHLKSGFLLGNELIEYFTSRGLAIKICETRLLLGQIYYWSQEFYRSLAELNKCEDSFKDFLQFEIPVKLAAAESSLAAFEDPTVAMNLLNSVESKLFNRKSSYLLGRFFKCKAKVSLNLAEKIQSFEVFQRVSGLLKGAETEFANDGNLWELREVFYLQARAFDKGKDFIQRDIYAEKFMEVNKQLNLASKCIDKRDKALDLELLNIV